MKSSELLREVRVRVTKPGAWMRRDNFKEFGWPDCGCVMNHFWYVAETQHGLDGLDPMVSNARDAMNDFGSIIRLNDNGPTRLWGVVARLGRAIRRLEAEGR